MTLSIPSDQKMPLKTEIVVHVCLCVRVNIYVSMQPCSYVACVPIYIFTTPVQPNVIVTDSQPSDLC